MKPFISDREKKLLMVGGLGRGRWPGLGGGSGLPACRPCHSAARLLTQTAHIPSPPRPHFRLPAPQAVIPLQAVANVAIIYLDEFTPAAESWFT